MRNAKSIALISFIALSLTACGQNFEANQAPCTNCGAQGESTDPDNTGGGESTGPNDDAWKSVDLDGDISQGQYSGFKAIQLDKENKKIVLTIPFPASTIMPVGTIALQGIPGATLSVAPVQSDDELVPSLIIEIPIQHLVKGLKFVQPSKLPNGAQTLVPDGELPALGIEIPGNKNFPLTLYLGTNVVGLYVKIPWGIPLGWTWPIKNAARTKTLGYFMLLPGTMQLKDGGFFLSLKVPADMGRALEQVID